MGFAKWGSFPGLCRDPLKRFCHSLDCAEVASQNAVTEQKCPGDTPFSLGVVLPLPGFCFLENVGGTMEVAWGFFLGSYKCSERYFLFLFLFKHNELVFF